ncbi:MAG: nucleotidyltransferase domain-containing protein [Pseudomonadota bacterium]
MAEEVIKALTREIGGFSQVEKIILFGSRARGDNGHFSDIDIAIFGQIDDETWSYICRLADVEDDTIKTLLKIDLVRFEKVGEELQKSIMEEGKILYER